MSTRATVRGGAWPVVAVLAGLAVVAQLYGLYRVTGPPSPPWFPHADKLEHALGFALPVALCLLAVGLRAHSRGAGLSRRALVVVIGVFAAHAVVSELVQHLLYRTRTGDPLDVLADAVGVTAGALAGSWLLRRRDVDATPHHETDAGRTPSAVS
jgi:VanZ family protein